MDQVHIGYKTWNDPPRNIMPKLVYVNTGKTNGLPALPKPSSQTAEALIPIHIKSPVFYEKDGYVSIEAADYTRAVHSGNHNWITIPDIGRTNAGVTIFPVTAGTELPGQGASQLSYEFYTYKNEDHAEVSAFFSPTLNFYNDEKGLQYAVSIDDEQPQLITINVYADPNIWRGWTANNIIIKKTQHQPLLPGKHTLKYWPVQPGLILQKLVVDMGGVKQSYLGPPETVRRD